MQGEAFAGINYLELGIKNSLRMRTSFYKAKKISTKGTMLLAILLVITPK